MIAARKLLALLTLAFAIRLPAQLILPDKGETVPTFEVATVKPSSKDLGRSFHTHIWWNDNTWRTENTTLRDLVRVAFNIGSNAQLAGGPDALLNARWDINARMDDEDYARLEKLPNEDRDRTLHLMLQELLADRFGLKVHTETRSLPLFDLVVNKGGAKLQSIQNPVPALTDAGASGATSPSSPAAKPSENVTTRIGRNQASVTATDATLAALTTMLSHQPELNGRIVFDKTGLAGRYNYSLQWSPQRLDALASADTPEPSLFTALKDQLGLKLESSKGAVEIIIVDAVSAPTPN